MKKLILIQCLIIIFAAAKAQHIGFALSKPTPSDTTVKKYTFKNQNALPIQNLDYGIYRFEQPFNKRDQLYNLKTNKYVDWMTPISSGYLHINAKDEIEVSNAFMFRAYQSLTESDSLYSSTKKDSVIMINDIKDIHKYIMPGFGLAQTVLITSDIDIENSFALKRIMAELNKSTYALFYLKKWSLEFKLNTAYSKSRFLTL